jgi:thioredoxin reductase (NADPH)
VEAALALAEQGNSVAVSYRNAQFSRLKPTNSRRIDEALARGDVNVIYSSHVVAIHDDVVYYRDGSGTTHELPNDYVFVMIGGELPTGFLRSFGVEIDTKFGEPVRA